MDGVNRIWELIAKKSAGEADEHEILELEKLLEDCGTDVHYMMNVMEHYWEEINAADEATGIIQLSEEQKNRALDEIAEQLLNDRTLLSHRRWTKKRRLYWSMSLSAVIAVMVIISIFVWNPLCHSSDGMRMIATKEGSRTKITLPDGSEVWLNSGSRLIYPKDFDCLSTREVTLDGEAYFKVKHDTNHPFIIHTDYLDIKDLGTVFNVKAYPDEKEAVATLISGSIAVSIKDDPGRTIVLKPHEKVSYFADVHGLALEKDNSQSVNKELKTIRPVALHNSRLEVSDIQPVVTPHGDTIVSETAWVNNELVFQGEKFSQLAERMQRWYNVTIKVENAQVADYTFTGIFNGETLPQALEELKMIRAFSFELERDTVVIK
jgi:ferric-dicitrate binding protein FerR (iron transport regulator)